MLRAHEWILLAYFWYAAAIAPFYLTRPSRAILLALAVTVLIPVIARFNYARDWLPVALVLTAYREMDWFLPAQRDYHLELSWIEWDRLLLYRGGFQRAIEALGPVLPAYLEFAYLLVYGIFAFVVAAMYFASKRNRIESVLTVYLLGTLLAYALFPYFPSVPPRLLFGTADAPHYASLLRRFNLFLVNDYGIHSSVFPSAHVSSAFSGAWALILFVPEHKWLGRGMLIYALSVAVAVVYGRYHFAVDALAGFGVSLVALGVGLALKASSFSRRAIQGKT
jgi:membrane-associated phospholipid phosphatase